MPDDIKPATAPIANEAASMPPTNNTDDAIVNAPTATPTPAADAGTSEVTVPIADTTVTGAAATEPVKESDVLPPISADTTATATAPISTAPESTPVVVTADDVKEVKDEAPEHQKLAEEIEILTGEIQALQAKIERLGGAITPATSRTDAPKSSDTSSPDHEDKPDLPPADLPPKAPSFSSTPPVAAASMSVPSPTFDASSSINDIYPKKDEGIKIDHSESKASDTTASADDQPSALGLIGEVVGVVGIVLLVLMLLSPLYKEVLGVTLWESLRTLGWLSTVGALLVGFLLALFAKGKATLKVVLFIFLLIGGLMYYGINVPGNFLETFLGSVLSFYQ